MQTYEIIVSGRAVHANSADTTLVRTSIGIDKIHVLFDNEEWTAFPVRVTFANGDTIISTSLTLAEIDAPEWAAEAECAIPWEVIQDLGGIRITFQGTDASGNHIITEASGEPLSVVEAGDVGSGTVPSPAPSVDEWNQAYANAMAAANSASGAAESATEAAERANTAAADAEQVLEDGIPLMDADTRGGAKLGDGLEVDENEALNAKVGGDISIDGNGAISYELPIMSATQHGGATLGSGLTVDDGALSLGDLVQSASGAEVATNGCAIYSVDGEGWATQDGTPTPDNPVEIEVCRGRNLLNPVLFENNKYQNLANASVPYNISNNNGTWIVGKQAVKESTQYVLNVSPLYNYIVCYDSSEVALGQVLASNGVFTTMPNTAYVCFTYNSTANAFGSEIQLELGTTPTPYVPYGHVGLEIGLGMNAVMFEQGAANATANNTYEQNKISSTTRVRSKELIHVSAGTTVRYSCADRYLCTAHVYDKSGVLKNNNDWSNNAYVTVVSAMSDDYQVAFIIRKADNSTISVDDVSSANARLDYIEPTTPIPLPAKGFAASLPDGTADALTVDSAGRWEWVNESDEVVFDGSSDENWGHNSSLKCFYTNSLQSTMKRISDATIVNGLCSHFVASYVNNVIRNENYFAGANIANGEVYLSYYDIDNVADWRTFLASQPMSILYQLATPTTEHGYIDLPALPSGATVSCPELEQIGVSWFVDGAKELVEHAENIKPATESRIGGGASGQVSPISNATIDAVVSDQSPTGTDSLQTTGLSYLWTKLKAAFASITHTHTVLGDSSTKTVTVNANGVAECSGTATGSNSHAEGGGTTAAGEASHAEGAGAQTTSSARAAHAEGSQTAASAAAAHAEGVGSTASGAAAHAEGQQAQARGAASHAEGTGTIAGSASQHVSGKYNVTDSSDVYAEIVGNGTSETSSNARTLDWDGNAWHAGDVVATDGNGNEVSLVGLKESVYNPVTKSYSIPRLSDSNITFTGYMVGPVTFLSAKFTAKTTSATNTAYLNLINIDSSLKTFGTWTSDTNGSTGIVSIQNNANAWLLGATCAQLSNNLLIINIVQFSVQ